MKCRFDGCGKDAHAVGLCIAHYKQQQRGEKLRPLRVSSETPLEPVTIRLSSQTATAVRSDVGAARKTLDEWAAKRTTKNANGGKAR